jgi:tRNA pseudouridine38-40 synthase
MANIKLIIAYDGKAYLGWQQTKEGASIEESLQKTLETLLQQSISLTSASRTDAGVHARGQVVNFYTEKKNLDLGRLLAGINALLPEDISVFSAENMHDSFHATIDCIGKEYHYWMCTAPILYPQDRHTIWHYPYSLDLNLMKKAAQQLIGEHDFQALCNMKKNEEYEDYIRCIQSISIEEHSENKFLFKIEGTSFLYKMARNIVGLVTYVGRGIIPLEDVPKIIQSKDRTRSGITAPAHGLTLYKVLYPENR